MKVEISNSEAERVTLKFLPIFKQFVNAFDGWNKPKSELIEDDKAIERVIRLLRKSVKNSAQLL